MVQNDIWKAYGAGDGMLCIGCLEKRIGRKLRRQDFIDLPIDEINPETQSLRLQDRLSTEPSRQRLLGIIGARCHIPIADAKTASVRHRARYAALRPSLPEGGRVEGNSQLFADVFCSIKSMDSLRCASSASPLHRDKILFCRCAISASSLDKYGGEHPRGEKRTTK